MTTAITHNELVLGGPIGSLEQYIQAVRAVPVLTSDFDLRTRSSISQPGFARTTTWTRRSA